MYSHMNEGESCHLLNLSDDVGVSPYQQKFPNLQLDVFLCFMMFSPHFIPVHSLTLKSLGNDLLNTHMVTWTVYWGLDG